MSHPELSEKRTTEKFSTGVHNSKNTNDLGCILSIKPMSKRIQIVCIYNNPDIYMRYSCHSFEYTNNTIRVLRLFLLLEPPKDLTQIHMSSLQTLCVRFTCKNIYFKYDKLHFCHLVIEISALSSNFSHYTSFHIVKRALANTITNRIRSLL